MGWLPRRCSTRGRSCRRSRSTRMAPRGPGGSRFLVSATGTCWPRCSARTRSRSTPAPLTRSLSRWTTSPADGWRESDSSRAGPGGERCPRRGWSPLTSTDPYLSPSLPADKVAAFAASIAEWVESGVASLARGRVCLRVHEPGTHPDGPPAARRGKTSAAGAASWWLEASPFGTIERLLTSHPATSILHSADQCIGLRLLATYQSVQMVSHLTL